MSIACVYCVSSMCSQDISLLRLLFQPLISHTYGCNTNLCWPCSLSLSLSFSYFLCSLLFYRCHNLASHAPCFSCSLLFFPSLFPSFFLSSFLSFPVGEISAVFSAVLWIAAKKVQCRATYIFSLSLSLSFSLSLCLSLSPSLSLSPLTDSQCRRSLHTISVRELMFTCAFSIRMFWPVPIEPAHISQVDLVCFSKGCRRRCIQIGTARWTE